MEVAKEFMFGIDEAGRGPLAGPVAVSVFGIKKGFMFKDFPQGKDSKKMSEKEREYWFEIFQKEKENGNVFFELAFGEAESIDSKGIVFSIKEAMETCLEKLEKSGVLTLDSEVLLDGALKAPMRFARQQTIIKGDEKEIVIGCASIIAKVSRDALMVRLAREHPEYGFERHKGYGTLIHRQNIKKYGISTVHRKSFIK